MLLTNSTTENTAVKSDIGKYLLIVARNVAVTKPSKKDMEPTIFRSIFKILG